MVFDAGGEYLGAVGRFMIGAVFVNAGLRHIRTFEILAGLMTARRVPFPRLSLASGITFQIIVGLAFAFGIERWATGLGLIIFTVAATIIAHNFWDKSGDKRTVDLFWWQANSAIIGGILLGMV
jgi:putative oxidoreductase